MGKRSEVPVTERREAVLSFLRREEPGAVIARRYGVAEATLYRWRDDFLAAGEAALAGSMRDGINSRDRQFAELERQIESRDQVIGELTIANRVLKKTLGAIALTVDTRRVIADEVAAVQALPTPRLVQVLGHLGIATGSWYRPSLDEKQRKRPGPAPKKIPGEVVEAVVKMATDNPWYGYKRIAVMCRRADKAVADREAYVVMRDHMDFTYIHIPGHGWWYAVTVIDYYSRYLLACHLTFSYSASQVIYALQLAREEAERIGGPLAKRPFLVTDNGPSFVARRFAEFVREPYSHVRIAYRTPQQLGLLERFHQTLKTKEVY